MASPVCLSLFATTSLLLVLVHLAVGGYERNCDFYRPPSPMGKCGKQLADLVDNVCKFYYGGRKRSADDQTVAAGGIIRPWAGQQQQQQQQQQQRQHENADIFLPKDRALSVLTKRGTYQGRITCECCHYQCTFHELSQYCSVTAIKRSPTIGIRSIIQPNPALEKENDDIRDKQMVGRLLRKFGPQWLEDYLQYLNY